MPGNSKPRKKSAPRRRKVKKYAGVANGEAAPGLPTSGQILGVLVRSLGITHPHLGDKTAQRFFSGRLKDRVMQSSRTRIIDAVSENMAAALFAGPTTGDDGEDASSPSGLSLLLEWHAATWDQFRAFLRPRVLRVYPENMAWVWRAYVRLAAIDLALRAAAHLHIAGASPASLGFLEFASVSRRGEYLNGKRADAGISLFDFAEAACVTDNPAQAWLYDGARPTDDHLASIASALAPDGGADERDRLLRELRKLYWVSDVAEVLGGFIGTDAMDEIIGRLHRYASLLYAVIDERMDAVLKSDVLGSLAAVGAQSEFSKGLLEALIPDEPDEDWQEDLRAAASNWTRRVLAVNLGVHRAEEDALIRDTDGGVFRDWDVSNPEAYSHYQRFAELQLQGRIPEAVAELEMAVKLDPLDPANQFTLGSFKGHIGAKQGNASLVQEGLEACWVAATLDKTWVLPWAEIGFILLESGRPGEAVDHLKAVPPERRPLDTRYYSALGAALRDTGRFVESLEAFQACLELNPDDSVIVAAAAVVAALAGDKAKSRLHARTARHMGASDVLDLHIELANAVRAHIPSPEPAKGRIRNLQALDAAIRRDPADAKAHMYRGMLHFEQGNDELAIADLDESLKLDPENSVAYYVRGTIHVYLKRHDRIIYDMSESLRINPGNAQAWFYRGLAYAELDDLTLAIDDLTEAIRLEPGNADAYRARGDCHRYKGEYDLAITDFNAALEIDPEHAWSYRGRGTCYRMMQDFDQAIANYDEAVRLEPEDFYARRFRGDAHLAMGEYDLAVADCETALAIGGPDEACYFYMGNARLFSGEFEQAIGYFNSAIESNSDSGRAYYSRALAKELKGDSEGSDLDYRRAWDLGFDESS